MFFYQVNGGVPSVPPPSGKKLALPGERFFRCPGKNLTVPGKEIECNLGKVGTVLMCSVAIFKKEDNLRVATLLFRMNNLQTGSLDRAL